MAPVLRVYDTSLAPIARGKYGDDGYAVPAALGVGDRRCSGEFSASGGRGQSTVRRVALSDRRRMQHASNLQGGFQRPFWMAPTIRRCIPTAEAMEPATSPALKLGRGASTAINIIRPDSLKWRKFAHVTRTPAVSALVM